MNFSYPSFFYQQSSTEYLNVNSNNAGISAPQMLDNEAYPDSRRLEQLFDFLSTKMDGPMIPTVPSTTTSSSLLEAPFPQMTVSEMMDKTVAALSCPPASNDWKGLFE